MSSSAERAAERINELHNLTDEYDAEVAAIIAEEYAELIKAASQAMRQWKMYADDERDRNEEKALREGDDIEAKVFQNCERTLAHAEGRDGK